MDQTWQNTVNWRQLFARRGFRYILISMFISLFGTGMNYAGVTWYILIQTNSTVSVSLMVILVTLPGLIVPPFGGVLIDRVDRRYLGRILDLIRGMAVLATAALVYSGRAQLWHIYTMVALLGVGAAIYCSTMNALVQEVMSEEDPADDEDDLPHAHLAGANAGVLIAVQAGMMSAGAVVGFIYERTGLGGILAIDGATYLTSALCLTLLRSGYRAPHRFAPREAPPTIEAPAARASGTTDLAVIPPIVEPGMATGFVADLKEGLSYLRTQPRVFAVGFTYACMMAGVISANVLLVVLARDILNSGPRGYGYLESGWAIGAIAGGLAVGWLVRRYRALTVLMVALTTLAIGHALFPYARWLWVAVAANALFGACRALGGVLTQTAIMSTVPPRLMGRTQSAFAVISTLLQVMMSFSLGWLAQHVNLLVAFGVLGLLYGGATLAAWRARSLAAT